MEINFIGFLFNFLEGRRGGGKFKKGWPMKYLVFLFMVLIVSCSTSPVDPNKAKWVPKERIYKESKKSAKNNSKITLVRDSGLSGAACSYGFYLDYELVADLNTSEKVEIYVPSGEHLLGLAPAHGGFCGGSPGLSHKTFLKENEEKEFRMSGGSWEIRPY
jgi:hypothetical protein